MTEKEAIERIKMILREITETEDTLDLAIKALRQVEKLRELRENLSEKERFYANQPHDNTLYSNGLADAYCTTNALIDEILGGWVNGKESD